ncbi:MAG TPA: deoxynucleoside kinase [Anaerolineae bacterium]|nr:deoxynucleoside kinase [Anaerolineae bacterium]
MPRHPYIAVEGVIGVGKTTLVRLLSKDFNAEPLLEVFEENPFLSDFYSDRARYAFQTQIFFLLSRYRQQHDVIPRALMHSALISDYTFAKDALFARLNLGGDEIAVYNRLHAALAEKIPKPDLLVYLRAGLDTLMARIAARDRPYERAMDRRYIESLRLAYDGFVAAYTDCPVLAIDTDELNFVQDLGALDSVRERIRAALRQGTFQQALPHMPVTLTESDRSALSELQRAQAQAGETRRDAIAEFLSLTRSVGEVSAVLLDGGDQRMLRHSLAACLSRLMHLADATGVDLDEAYRAYSARK